MAGRLDSTRNTLGIAELRTRTRTLVTTPMYVDLGKVNGGLVFNLSEDGLALTAACGLIFGTSKDQIALTAAANIVRGDGVCVATRLDAAPILAGEEEPGVANFLADNPEEAYLLPPNLGAVLV